MILPLNEINLLTKKAASNEAAFFVSKMDLTSKLKSKNQVRSMCMIVYLGGLFVEMIMSTGFEFTDQNCKPKP